jgi:hypothetical protein
MSGKLAKIPRRDITDAQRLRNLADALADDILTMSDGQITAELIEDGQDPREIADRMRAIFRDAIARHKGSTP